MWASPPPRAAVSNVFMQVSVFICHFVFGFSTFYFYSFLFYFLFFMLLDLIEFV
jgi:hypothetical protein